MSSELFKRIKNAVYTTAENYDLKVGVGGAESYTDTEKVTVANAEAFMSMGLSQEDSSRLVMQAAAHEGAHCKLSDMGGIRELFKTAKADGANLKKLNNLIQIAEDYRVDSTIARERPGYWDDRKNNMEIVSRLYKDKPTGNPDADFIRAVSLFTHDTDLRKHGWNKAPVDWAKAIETAGDIKRIANKSKNSLELANAIYDYYKDLYDDEESSDDSEDDSTTEDGKSSEDSTSTSSKKSKTKSAGGKSSDDNTSSGSGGGSTTEEVDDDSTPKDTSTEKSDAGSDDIPSEDISDGATEDSAEDSSDSTSESSAESDKELEEALEELKSAMDGKDTLEDLLGKTASEALEEAKRKVEGTEAKKDELTKGAEATYKRYMGGYTMLWSEQERNQFMQINCVGIHAGADVLYGKRNSPRTNVSSSTLMKYDGVARNLGNMLIQTLKAEADNRGEVAASGSKLIANKAWKPMYTCNQNVFFKRDYTEVGGYVIDLLLDASGSQGSREYDICIQAYIIARACSIAGIPCRVTQFENKSSFTIVERLRDFDDPKEYDLNCGQYRSGGDNRDGLAILIVNHELQKRQEPNKVLLILSDGAPCDSSGAHKLPYFGGLGNYIYYTTAALKGKDPTVNDVYNVVRKIRKSGTAVMGVYVGAIADTRQIEKLMYGSDFASISDMETFVPTIMKYLVKHIQGFDR